jgi:hypothetical protein
MVDNPLPLNLGPLEINEKTKRQFGGSQIVETLRHMFVGEAIDALQLYH